MSRALATSRVRVAIVEGPMAVTAASRTWGRRASAAPARAPSPLKVGRIWMGGVAGVLTGATERATPAVLTPKATVTWLQGPGRVAGDGGMVRATEPVGLGCKVASKATPPVRSRTPPMGAVVASWSLTGSAAVPAPVAVSWRLPGRERPGPAGRPARFPMY